ncbi:MAG: thioredoxin domain-containing protein [Thaumarchaeota archaeon]|nr:thioredoxin domain-containing protein [Nitrososphaerota archaeon]
MTNGKPNRLFSEKSPYLLKHAFNPTDWYPWGDEALKRAKNDGKPIFLSIGYSTCHWCAVMERESFEDASTAEFLNKNFIPIKVDREERPELDAYYMRAVQAMTGGGGWPLSVFLTPDLKPFYGGTYFPSEPRFGMPSFKQVLEFVAKVWKDKRAEIVENAAGVAKAISGDLEGKAPVGLSKGMLDDGYAAMVGSFDPEHGGFGGSPKFPLPLTGSFLLRYHFRTGKELALSSVVKTLDSMMDGGIRDHVGGGFHRYSTDRVWLVPHFEKMLYDNALLARLCGEAYQVTGTPAYAKVARDTLGWIVGEMRDPSGGFYSAQDADTEEGEGTYYTWMPSETIEALGEAEGAKFNASFGVTKNGNFEGRTILHKSRGGAPLEREVEEGWIKKLYKTRVKRPRPANDEKILTSWNGLAISALATVGTILGEQSYVDFAREAAEFILGQNVKEGRLLRRSVGGEAALDGTLEDYAFFVQGLLDLFEATAEPKWLEESVRLTMVMRESLEDKENGGFFLVEEAQPARIKEGYDGPTPSGNSVAAHNLVRLAEMTGEEEFRRSAEATLKFYGRELEQQPSGHANLLAALDLALNGVREIVIVANTAKGAGEMRGEVLKRFMPKKVVVVATAESYVPLSRMSELLKGRKPGPKARAYVCENFACKLPADSVAALRAQLEAK